MAGAVVILTQVPGGDYRADSPYLSTDATLSLLHPHGCLGTFQLSLAEPSISMYLPSDRHGCSM